MRTETSKKITSVEPDSLILIDEVEMALHPQAQVRLLQRVTEIAAQKNLTVLFSTHSATLIKNAPRKKLIHLKVQADGCVSTTKSAFPAQILGEVAFDDELATDFIFYVEDKQAKILVEQLVAMYMTHCQPDKRYRPLFKVVPVGGFTQVLEMLSTSGGIFPPYVKRFALLDEDVKSESLVIARRENNQILLDLFDRVDGSYYFLPCTPEVGVIELIELHARNDVDLMTRLCQAFPGHRIHVNQIVNSRDYQQLNRANPRDKAKDRLKHFVEKIVRSTGVDELHVQRVLYAEYADHKYSDAIGQLRQLLGPVFNAR
jgi:hypothetical protein